MTREEADYSDWGQIEEKNENIICVLDKIKAEIQTEVTHWLNRRNFYDDWKHIDLTGTPWLKENKHRNIQEIACARYSARAEGLEKALEIIDKYKAEERKRNDHNKV